MSPRRSLALVLLSTLLAASVLSGCVSEAAPPAPPAPANLVFQGAPWRVTVIENATDGQGVWLNLTMVPESECLVHRPDAERPYAPVQTVSVYDYHGFRSRLQFDAPLGTTTSHRIELDGDGPFLVAGGRIACADPVNSTLSGIATGRQIRDVQFVAGAEETDNFVAQVPIAATIPVGGTNAVANWQNDDVYVFGLQQVDVDSQVRNDDPGAGVGFVTQTLSDATGRVQYQAGCTMVVQGCTTLAGPYVYVDGAYTFQLDSEAPVVPGELRRGLLLTVNRLQPDVCGLGFHWDLCGGVDEEDPHANH